MTTTFEIVQDTLAEKYSVAKESITPDATLESLGLDSLDLIELLFEVEDQFSIRVPQDGGSALRTATVKDIVDSIDKLLAEKGPDPAGGQ